MSSTMLYTEVATDLENQEIEGLSGPALVEAHSQLLCIYICNFDLCNAKLLWKRISAEQKAAHPILGQIWNVGKQLWLKDHNAVFGLIRSTAWPETLQPYMSCLEERYRQKSLQLIGKAYISVNSSTFASLMGYAEQPEAAEALLNQLQQEQGWTSDPALHLIVPKKLPPQNTPMVKNEDQLQSLTQFVSFLEN